ncbi:zinc finger CCCH domain-containing protein 13-like [Gymnodraco acuticeps]|uniref:Zinc finger CCCH domain-containing protein 13-like n=1 Tax=Gymnodraco acuticeps TaxID=8218 RepID=A0A6P8VJC3_GYMAC|nr:zinc finger CCCH domain-containing protein 13-like [Gymnodraco acuticeps]XP_034090651.1 zinc finger CCCH domain-containing protein 13-like [Gymnodraco acuticeps]XP_034090652.1 zinc finger CCCH domain-containing protein 13-like [Gymnodraco acuticeps]
MGKPLSRPGCFRKSSCCLEKHGAGDGGVGGRAATVDGGYGDGYVPQRSIYDTMCINQQIDSHHHHSGGSIRRDGGNEGSFSYSASGSLRVSRSPADMFDSQPRSLTPNPSFVRRLDERAIFDSLKLGGQDVDGVGCHSPGCFNRSVSPSMSSFSAPGVSSSSSKKHHHHPHHHHGDSAKSRDGRHSWKVMTPPTQMECMEYTTTEMMDRGGGYLNPGQYPPPGGQSSSLTSPLISPFSGSPLSSGYHTPVFFSPAKPRPSQSQSLRCSPPHVIQPRHYSQTQSLRMSPPLEVRRSPYRAPLVQLSAHDLEQEMRDRGGGWRNERERDWEREREREMERGWAQREWERERERGRVERERARERERRETSSFGTFGYGRPVPLRSDRDSVFLEPDQVLDTTPLLLPQPSPSPSPSPNAPRMGTAAVGRNRAGSKVGSEGIGGGMVSKYDNGSVGLVLIDSKSGYGPRLVNEVGNMSEAEIRAAIKEHHRAESWNQHDHGSRASVKNGSEKRMGSQVKTRPGGRDLEGKVQSGVGIENMAPTVNKEGHKGGTRSGEINGRGGAKQEPIAESTPSENRFEPRNNVELVAEPGTGMKPEIEAEVEVRAISRQVDNLIGNEVEGVATVNSEVGSLAEPTVEAEIKPEVKMAPSEPEAVLQTGVGKETGTKRNIETGVACQTQSSNEITDKAQINVVAGDKTENAPVEQDEKKPLDIDNIESSHVEKCSRSRKSKSSKSTSRTRPGTATGIRPGVVSPCLSRGFPDLEQTSPAEGIESTWPRRIIVRKRTVRQGGALHNLPILPPLPSVLSALEKRHPHVHLLPRPGHYSENPLTTLMNATSIMGRCSLKEPSHQDPGQSTSLVGRASLKEQNLEHWRVCREQEEPKRSRSKEKQAELSKGKTEIEEMKGKEEKRDKERGEEKDKKKEKVGKEKERVPVSVGLVEETKREKSERRVVEKVPEDWNIKERVIKERVKKERDIEIICLKKEDKGMETKDAIQGQHGKEFKQVVTKSKKEESEVKGGEEEGGPLGEEEGWDTVLDMVNTLWEDGWEKGGAGGGDDTDSFSGSLPRWPLLRPPMGFGGSHPPSSAASELSLTELERRARELDSDLEHLDLSQPHRDTQDVYQPLLEPQRERADMYQTHPGPQRDKAALMTGTGSRSHISLELTAMASPTTDTERPSDWSTKPAGTSTVGTSSTKEDSSPDSNLTLESDSSGVFLSLSNQSQEEAGSDSDQPISGSDLGSSSTSLEKDGEDGGSKEWGREESAELQWCYPTLFNTSLQEDIEGDRDQEEAGYGNMGTYERGGKDGNVRRGW